MPDLRFDQLWRRPAHIDHPDWQSYPLRDDALVEAYDVDAARRLEAGTETGGPAGDWWTLYDAFLQIPEWKALRAKVIQRAGKNVHHTTYRFGPLAPGWTLRAISLACHKRVHGIDEPRNERRRSGARYPGCPNDGIRRVLRGEMMGDETNDNSSERTVETMMTFLHRELSEKNTRLLDR